MSIARFDQVIKNYTLGGQQVQALKDITLNTENGAVLAIAGRGKPTQLNLIGCIDTPSLGRIFINGQGISGQMSDEHLGCQGANHRFYFSDVQSVARAIC